MNRSDATPPAPALRLSVVIPIYNEEEVLPELLRRLGAVLDGIDGQHEIILVDDGSRDRSVAIIEEAAKTDPRLVLVQLARNFGHQAALSAGMDEVRGQAAILMDADLQDVPEEIPRFIAAWEEGADVVYARRTKRKEPLWLRAAYYSYYRILARFSDIEQPLDAGDFSLLARPVVDTIRGSREHNRYLRGLRTWVGFRQVGIEVERAERAAGESKYNLSRLFKLGFDGLFSFSSLPVRVATLVGICAIGLSGVYLAYALYVKLMGGSPDGFTALVFIIVFLLGIQFVFLGVLGEYIHRILDEVRARPLYVVRRRIGRDEASSRVRKHDSARWS